jgi:hypothetical protein
MMKQLITDIAAGNFRGGFVFHTGKAIKLDSCMTV